MPIPANSGDFSASLFPVSASAPLSTQTFVPRTTPGNVAICLSGGGSRALSAGMGQLQALELLQANGASLLSQARAISTVSGGGWLGIPFVYLPPGFSDANFLGSYIDPSDLTLSSLDTLLSTNIGAQITSDFSLVELAVEASYLYTVEDVPADMLWQTLIGIHILGPYGLYPSDSSYTPTSLFSYDSAALAKYVTGPNPSLGSEIANLIAEPAGQQRPYLVSNSAMFVTTSGGQIMLAPVQSTPFTTGIISVPPNSVDANNRQVGGGGVTSFAFNSAPLKAPNNALKVQQSRQWSLMDIAGTSSAAFAAALKLTLAKLAKSPPALSAAVRRHKERAVARLSKAGADAMKVDAYLQSLIDAADRGDLVTMKANVAILEEIIPAYSYWPVLNPPYGKPVGTTQFADGGLLENCGIAAMLAYSDIDTLIAFVNSEATLSQDDNGVIVVDDSIPPLFGFQPYNGDAGYVPYAGATDPYYPLFQNNQVFASNQFQTLLNQLWAASGSGSYQSAPIVNQPLVTVENKWFGVTAGKSVTVLWVHLEIASDWYNAFTDYAVTLAMDGEIVLANFPHYNTLNTELSAIQVNLLSSLTAWTVAAAENSGNFTSLFTTNQAKAEHGD
jgi:hypothetical protein